MVSEEFWESIGNVNSLLEAAFGDAQTIDSLLGPAVTTEAITPQQHDGDSWDQPYAVAVCVKDRKAGWLTVRTETEARRYRYVPGEVDAEKVQETERAIWRLWVMGKAVEAINNEESRLSRPRGGRPKTAKPTPAQWKTYFSTEARSGTLEAERVLSRELGCSARTVRRLVAGMDKTGFDRK